MRLALSNVRHGKKYFSRFSTASVFDKDIYRPSCFCSILHRKQSGLLAVKQGIYFGTFTEMVHADDTALHARSADKLPNVLHFSSCLPLPFACKSHGQRPASKNLGADMTSLGTGTMSNEFIYIGSTS